MSDTEKNGLIIKDLHLALTRGDIPALLGHLADNVDWRAPMTLASTRENPWSKPRQNRSAVESYFKDLFRKIRYDRIETVSFIAQGETVVLEGTAYGTTISTASPYRSDFVMTFTVREGKVIRFRHYYDPTDLTDGFHPQGKRAFSSRQRLKYVKLF